MKPIKTILKILFCILKLLTILILVNAAFFFFFISYITQTWVDAIFIEDVDITLIAVNIGSFAAMFGCGWLIWRIGRTLE